MKHAQRLLVLALLALPVLSVALNAIGWLRYGLDLPFFDDWRGYASGKIGSLDSDYLFSHVNDTRAPVGFALDSLAQRYLDGNSIAYQFLSMTLVLGGLLWLQLSLLRTALFDARLVAACFVLTLLMLQPGSYWGRENLAYHQALPLLGLLASLRLVLDETIPNRWRIPGLLLSCALAGLSYISGAFAVLAAGGALLMVALVMSRAHLLQPRIQLGAVVMIAVGAAVTLYQVWPILVGETLTHRPDAPIALPFEADFWFFLLGKIGRSLLLPQDHPLRSLVVVGFLLGLVHIVLFLLVWKVLRQAQASPDCVKLLAIFAALYAAIAVYLALVAAGRTNLRPPDVQSALQVFAYGYYRFHFFWAALLWPWLAAGCLAVAGWSVRGRRWISPTALTLAVVLVPLLILAGAMNHVAAHREEVSYRIPTVECLLSALQRGGEIHCAEFNMPDLSGAYHYARMTGASFVRYFPIMPLPLGTNDPVPQFRLSRDKHLWDLSHLQAVDSAPGRYRANVDSQLRFGPEGAEEMRRCSVLDVDVLLGAEQPDRVQLFYKPAGLSEFEERFSMWQDLSHALEEPGRVHFRIESREGFERQFRLDPVVGSQMISIREIELRCRLAAAGGERRELR